MSLQHDTAPTCSHAAKMHTSGVSSAVQSLLAPLIEGHHRYRIAQIRKATTREIRHLPSSLQQDLAFADGTVIPLS
ncbi:MAG TPA: hypothetical protein VL202_14930 [Pararhizobium sp.]|uniref:hypothetical protein n=1 Tax=Pararhizobium sp. TaxID=1977563 RepID=UPI002C3AF1D3|nr:hypothetical protein [Pararhizobium sp.]HTO32449.1 hypothetical protein [Pararhizobium sp.]